MARRLNQSTLKEVNPEYSLEGLMLKLKLQYFGHMMQTDSWEKALMLVKLESWRRRGWQRMRWFDDITDSMAMSRSKLWEKVKDREARHTAVHRVTKSRTCPSNWNKILTRVSFSVLLVQLFLLQCFLYQDLLTPTLMYDFPSHSKSMYDFSFFPILDFMACHFSNTLFHTSYSGSSTFACNLGWTWLSAGIQVAEVCCKFHNKADLNYKFIASNLKWAL